MEDYSQLENSSDPLVGINRLKYLSLDRRGQSYVSFGAEYRWRSENYDDINFGLSPNDDDFISNAQRIYAHADFHFSERIRVFSQLAYAYEDGREPRSRSPDRSDPDIQQFFFDVNFSLAAQIQNTLRVGRQSLPLGSGRLLSARNGPNLRRVFDLALLDTQIADKWNIHVLAGRPVANDRDAFGDEADEEEKLWGVYTTHSFSRNALADVYYLVREREQSTYLQGTADEYRRTVGIRFKISGERYEGSVESAYQFGSFGADDIDAWGVILDARYLLSDTSWQPKLGLIAGIASGDSDAGDDELGTFNALYPNLAYFTPAAIVAPANSYDIFPYLDFIALGKLSTRIGLNFIWRLEAQDAVYGAGYRPLTQSGNDDGDQAATLLNWSMKYQLNRYLSIDAAFVKGLAEKAIETAGGEDFDFVFASLSLRF